jgi:hypothetical protein
MTAARLVATATVATLVGMPGAAFAGELAEGVIRENGVVAIGPCDLIFSISDRWVAAPPEIFTATGNFRGFMLGKQGLVDLRGKQVVPTIAVMWEPITYIAPDEAHGNVTASRTSPPRAT